MPLSMITPPLWLLSLTAGTSAALMSGLMMFRARHEKQRFQQMSTLASLLLVCAIALLAGAVQLLLAAA